MIERYNYEAAVKQDVLAYINEEIDLSEWRGRTKELREYLNNFFWTCYRLDGNASGLYSFRRLKAEEALSHNCDLISAALTKFGLIGTDALRKGPEAIDAVIRCYVLNQAVFDVLNELSEELEEEEN